MKAVIHLCVFCLAFTFIASGCRKHDLESRRTYSIENAEKHARAVAKLDYAWIWEESVMCLLDALKKSDLESLKEPTLVSALYESKDDQIAFVVDWIEDKPSITAIGISSTGSDAPVILQIPDAYHKGNEDVSKTAVTYYVWFSWQTQTKPSIFDKKNCVAYLIRGDEPVTESVPVKYKSELQKPQRPTKLIQAPE